jgi:FtsH-binding integral membrane protein
METLRLVLLFVHILGFAALLGGLLVQVREQTRSVNPLMRDGSGTAFLAGLLLVGVLEAGDGDVNNAKIGVKFAIGLVILVLVMVNMRKPSIPQGLYLTLLGLTLLNIVLAVFWSPTHA